ncbi:MAG: hypothetical protein EP343_33720 [Deltaproteobacteria bacterium]|nr:MAG: hypothetical protein EP343_33720 [Deltaproteobacteria bacterium]
MTSSDYNHILKDLLALRNSGEVTSDEFERTKQYVLAQYPHTAESPLGGDLKRQTTPDPQSFALQYSRGTEEASLFLPTGGRPVPTTSETVWFDRYQLIQPLGWGSYGYTCLVNDLVEQKLCSLKWLHSSFTESEGFLKRWLPAMEQLQGLSASTLATVRWVGCDTTQKMYGLVSEYKCGVTLEHWLQREPFMNHASPTTWRAVMNLFQGIVEALSSLHRMGWSHGNLKPSNIVISVDGSVSLLDCHWGLALEQCLAKGELPLQKQPWFKAPEQCLRVPNLSNAADVYGATALFYFMLSGKPPVGSWTPLCKLHPSLPQKLDAWVAQGLAAEPEQRHPSMQDWWHTLGASFEALGQQDSLPLRELLVASFSQSELQAQSNPEDVLMSEVKDASKASDTAPPLSHAIAAGQASLRGDRTVRRGRPGEGESRPTPPRGRTPNWSRQLTSEDELLSLDAEALEKKPALSINPDSLADTKDGLPRQQDSVLLYATLADELELEVEGTPLPSGRKLPSLHFTSTHLPELEVDLDQRLLYAKDQTPLLIMVKIPKGSFLMGSDPAVDPMPHENDRPLEQRVVSEYWISRTLITNRVWLKFVEESGYHNPLFSYLQHWRGGRPMVEQLEHPVVHIAPNDLEAFCDFYGLSVPTEEQWEKGARGTDGATWPWGNEHPDVHLCNFLESQLHDTSPVASYPDGASPFGLLDCSGNVWEWCLRDAKDSSATPTSSSYVVRGGCFRDYRRNLRCVSRATIHDPADFIGARVVASHLGE